MSVLRHLLVLTASTLLVLPTGWCCILAVTPSSTATAAAPADCCTSCCPQLPTSEEAPTRVPMTLCCCENVVPLANDGVAKVTPDAAAVALPVVDAPTSAEHPFLRATRELCLSPPRAIHVLQCLWLC